MPKRAIVARQPANRRAPTTRRAPAPKDAPEKDGRVSTASPDVWIQAPGVDPIPIATGSRLQQAAMEWSWVIRNRARWASEPESVARQSARSRTQLQALGMDAGSLDALAATEIIQVSVPFSDEATGWEARVFPWEFVLSAVNRDPLAKRPLIVRRLVVDGADATETDDPAPDPALIVVSAPGVLQRLFSFSSERRLVEANLEGVTIESIEEDSDARVRARIAALKPKAIHLAGVDSYQGAALLKLDTPEHDGFLMADARGVPRPIDSEQLAGILAAGGPVRLVACNFWNSTARTAAMAVALGAEAAIGFQDQVDDSTAELFLATFYANWRRSTWRIGPAFEQSLADVKRSGASLKGAGVVLWSRRDLLAGRSTADERLTEPQATWVRRSGKAVSSARAEVQRLSIQEALTVEARPLTRVNYSLLHNDQRMFDTFRIRKLVPDTIRGVEVEVVLYAGGDSYPYRTALEVKDSVTDLRDRVRVPLTSTVLRAFRESIRSVVYVGVKVGGEVIFQDTWRVTLVPVEEWSDDNEGGRWLPSFVLPRDPAVSTVVDAAYPIIRALREDAKNAFDGYQSVNPNAVGDAKYRTVEQQVRALWSALTYQFDLRYINPPPTYSQQSQRLRTPSEVLRSRAGTCIDLALLLAACLEYIDIYPVLFLLPGHALPGFWRTSQFQDAFRQVQSKAGEGGAQGRAGNGRAAGPGSDQAAAAVAEAASAEAAAAASAAAEAPPSPWLHRTNADASGPVYSEIASRLSMHHLVPLETVMMTTGNAYLDAIAGAGEMLGVTAAGSMLESMVDIRAARLSNITPLPSDEA
jgi:hypothetical protein